jgi:TRAP-type uncharacterized transport system fused permease subunit
MGAAAFLMVEYLNRPYGELIRHAFLPAVLAYISLLFIVHIEALKAGMQGIPRPPSPLRDRIINWSMAVAGVVLVMQVGLWLTELLPSLFGEAASLVAAVLLVAVFAGLVKLSAKYPEESGEISVEEAANLPPARPTVLGGLYFIVPIWILIWNLMVLEQSPALAAFWACTFTMVMLFIERPLVAWARGRTTTGTWRQGWEDLLFSLDAGARNMIGIAIATGTAGIIVGVVRCLRRPVIKPDTKRVGGRQYRSR